MWTNSEIDWENVELVVMIVSVVGTLVSGYVAMRRDKRGDDSLWQEISAVKVDLARKADQESIHAIHLDLLKMRMKLEDAAEVVIEEKADSE